MTPLRLQHTVAVANRQRAVKVAPGLLRAAALAAAGYSRLPPGAISVAVVGDAKMRELNRRFSGVDAATDVLAFELSPAGGADRLLGEVVVNAAAARIEAAARRRRVRDELLLYVVHGVLHLGGYRDATPAERRRMRAAEACVVRMVRGAAATGRKASRRR